MIPPDWIGGLGGGMLIGLAAVLLFALEGRMAGISGIFGGLLSASGDRGWRLAFLLGLPAGAALVAALAGGLPQQLLGGWPTLVVAGLLVGFGTRLGSGCTSGHGVCGIARGSLRSITATALFMATGILTVFVLRHLLT